MEYRQLEMFEAATILNLCVGSSPHFLTTSASSWAPATRALIRLAEAFVADFHTHGSGHVIET
jgi:hypothetical protein